ncbi:MULTISPECIES: biotin/lipoyl-containing protein [unclassified Enterococcus]|uniref:biotin/lipoyl-containing protein n=1 Tax=unclassified Enterococcus TaxID=2608891 RepID=UPI001557B67A|nr:MULTISPECIES: biotin/lipoyl-containing protein [unclassified Enterococcus]MBS7575932.1 acetyl-CoA carboxylase biotin carboxyl carrier protein subunit [Enterococcus sp. MMGLQ5-2]MBS7583165.1 acetyl-CoA carboxylase biotin carboxyl carrier protein subunit [Enterococcus sp. MMGLQ5-1]NPD11025.1 acetyl-CoA carboxylase biotin carboxyl carrier protein subunit [Enterococcus sp. MMGLQ5-1]NPD35768.1 acetyl-CoA carboxylase biotin carboxyl carrier protein subunit [Enterococcus sp. MMGLQ5-2]
MLRKFKISIDGVSYLVEMEELTANNSSVVSENISPTRPVEIRQPSSAGNTSEINETLLGTPVYAPMPGKILKLLVQKGDSVIENQPLLILEAMKMENQIVASKAGDIVKVHILEGQNIDSGGLLLEIG